MRVIPLLALLLPLAATALERETIELAGSWETVRADGLKTVPETGWTSFEVPGTVSGYRYTASWFRRAVDIPASWQGRRVAIRFGGVRWNSRVYVNEQLAGGHFNGFDAFELDVTGLVRPGAANQIRVGAHDFTGVFDPASEPVVWNPKRQVRDDPVDRALAPIGGHVTQYGIWDRCQLVATAPVHTDDLAISTSVRQNRLSVGLTAVNPTASEVAVEASAEVRERGTARLVLALPPRRVTVAAGGQTPLLLETAWPDARRWSPDDPYLYDLRVRLAVADGPADEQQVRFGFRELWTADGDFYLNGAKVHLLASSWWPPGPPATDQQVRSQLLALRAANTFVFRTHTQPWPQNWYTIADELGVMMIPEGAVWNDRETYRIDDPRFWDNYRAHLLAMVRHLRNHASVVMWSLENEFHGPGLSDETPAREARLAALADDVRALDPTRPVTFESDGDPGNKADVIGLHYPNEWPRKYAWPNVAEWLEGPHPDDGPRFFWDQRPFRWDRKKPLYIGEFHWIPSNNPDASTVFLGDAAYRDYPRTRTLAKAISWDMQIRAYRRGGLSGMSPWTMVEGGPPGEENPLWVVHRRAYQRQAAWPREYDSRFFAGDRVRRTIDIFNDTLAPATMTLSVRLGAAEPVTMALPPLAPGGQRTEPVELIAPSQAGESALVISLTANGQELFVERQPIRIYPRPAPLPAVPLYDPRGNARGLGLPPLASLDGALPRLLVVGPGAIQPEAAVADAPVVVGERTALGTRLADHVRGGGRLLVLAQRSLPPGLFGLQVNPRESTMAFAVGESAVLAGIGPEDLKFWRGDHLVTAGELRRPGQVGALALAVTGSGAGVDGSPLLELRQGAGVALFCTLRLAEKAATEPAAAQILRNALEYLQSYRARPSRSAVWGANPALRTVIDATGLDAEPLAAPAPDPTRHDVALVCEPPLADCAPALRKFAEGGGTLVLSHVAAGSGDLAAVGLPGVALSAYPGEVTRNEQLPAPFDLALLREDLYWLAPQTAVLSWTTRSRLPGQAVAAISPRVDEATAAQYPATAMEVSGSYAGKEADRVYLASSGTIRGVIKAPVTGRYVLGVRGWGTPCHGIYPILAVSVGRLRVGSVALGAEPASHGVEVQLSAGEQSIELEFINDENAGGEDRNAYVAGVSLAPTSTTDGYQVLTSPAAVITREVGRGRVILDNLRWEQAPGNELKAQRYLAGLLTAAGAAAAMRGGGAVVQGELMRIQPGLEWVKATDDHLAMVQASWAEADIEVRTAGAYRLTITARATPARDEWPHVVVSLDGQPLGEVQVVARAWRDFVVPVSLPAGRHLLRVTYDNDLQDVENREDRNLFLDRVTLTPAGEETDR